MSKFADQKRGVEPGLRRLISKRQAAVPVFRHSCLSYTLDYSSVLFPGRQAFALAIILQETWQ